MADAFLVHVHAPVWLAIAFSVAFVALQFVVSPWLINWVMRIYWTDLPENAGDFPKTHREFLGRLCAERKLRLPRIGVSQNGICTKRLLLRPPAVRMRALVVHHRASLGVG